MTITARKPLDPNPSEAQDALRLLDLPITPEEIPDSTPEPDSQEESEE